MSNTPTHTALRARSSTPRSAAALPGLAHATLVAAMLATSLAGCASEVINDSEADGAADTTDRDTTETEEESTPEDADGSGDTEEIDEVDDSADAEPDTAPEETSDTPADTPDTSVCEELGEECEARSIFCNADQTGVSYCDACGFVIRTTECPAREVCDTTLENAACRPCNGAECPPEEPECTPSSRECLDFNTVAVCDSEGFIDSVSDCPSGRRCLGGSCSSPGAATGEACSVNIDPNDGCVGHLCVCGEEYLAAGGIGCDLPGLSGGYCSTVDCRANGCDEENEVCADFAVSGAFAGQSLCVSRSRCAEIGRGCGLRSGFTCVELPGRTTAGALEWDLGCWPDLVPTIGEACTSDADCLGGDCRQRTVSGDSVSYCAAACGSDADCPSHAACVEDPDRAGAFACLALGNDVNCPRMESEPLHIARTSPIRTFDGGSESVCYFAR